MTEAVKNVPVLKQVPVPEKYRVDLMLAFSRKRAADAELRSAKLTVEALVAKFDKDGQLAKAILGAQTVMQQANVASLKLNAVLNDVQKALGTTLDGMQIDPDSGNLLKPEMKAVPAPTKVIPIKGKRHKK